MRECGVAAPRHAFPGILRAQRRRESVHAAHAAVHAGRAGARGRRRGRGIHQAVRRRRRAHLPRGAARRVLRTRVCARSARGRVGRRAAGGHGSERGRGHDRVSAREEGPRARGGRAAAGAGGARARRARHGCDARADCAAAGLRRECGRRRRLRLRGLGRQGPDVPPARHGHVLQRGVRGN
ncbi:PP180 [Orf virus]|uniref:PP180 n=1 Tax=Orf virus TaxID=10258 RepID=F1AX18_ORFV|nr:PP180 [Orf virus]